MADYDAMSKKAAELFAQELRENKNGVFGFATGSTPVGMYKELVRMYEEGTVDFTGITAFNLDEYYPIQRSDPQSYYYFMNQHLFGPVKLPEDRRYIPDGTAADAIEESAAYEQKIVKVGGIDLQVLGIGQNGHIGFNEPAEPLDPMTGLVALAEDTIQINSRFFSSPDDVPRNAISMGMYSVMMAKRILLLASGESKAAILRDSFNGPLTTLVPASLLQLHQNVTIVTDEAAARLL
jgi:glucosamine-6-phosphate deaminase